MLAPGRFRDWALWGSVEIRPFDVRTEATEATPELERVLANSPAVQGDVVDVADGTVALVQRDARPCKVLPVGRWIVWRGEGTVSIDVVDVAALRTAIPVAFWSIAGAGIVTEVLVRPFERVLVYADGVLIEVLQGGRYGLSPWRRKIDLVKLDVREQELQIKEIAEKIANLTVVVAPKDMQDLLRIGVDPSKWTSPRGAPNRALGGFLGRNSRGAAAPRPAAPFVARG